MLPSSSEILAEAINTKILTKNHRDSPHPHPDSPHFHPDSQHSYPHSPHSHPDSSHSHPDSPQSHPDSPHSNPDPPHSHLDSPRSHPESPCSHPDSPRSHHFPHSVPRFPIPSFTDSPAGVKFQYMFSNTLIKISFAKSCKIFSKWRKLLPTKFYRQGIFSFKTTLKKTWWINRPTWGCYLRSLHLLVRDHLWIFFLVLSEFKQVDWARVSLNLEKNLWFYDDFRWFSPDLFDIGGKIWKQFLKQKNMYLHI